MASLKETAQEAVAWLKAEGLDAELYLSRSEERGLDRRDGALDGIQQTVSEGAGLRVLSKGRMGFACAAGVSLETIRGLCAKVKAQLPHLENDAAKTFPAAAGSGDAALEASLWDDALFTEDWDSITEKLRAVEDAALAADKRVGSILRAGYGEARGEVVIGGTNGLLTCERGGSCSVGLSALSEVEGDSQVGFGFPLRAQERRFRLEQGRRAGGSTHDGPAGASKPPTGRRSVVFDPWVAGEFLDLVSGLLCADQVQRGKSLLTGKLGKKIGSELVTFIDDPRLPGGLSSSIYDDEGLATRRKVMIEGGVVKEFFYDAYTAKKDRLTSNASAGRGSYRGLPSPGCSNFYLAPGALKREALIADTRDGLMVLDVMGMHMADPISGEFSVGVSGLLIEKGKLGKPVKAAMISGNLLDLLDRVDAVADDLTFYGGMGAPTFRVSHMTVA